MSSWLGKDSIDCLKTSTSRLKRRYNSHLSINALILALRKHFDNV